MTRLRLDPTSPNGISPAPEPQQVRTVTNAVPRLQTLDDLQDVVVSGTPDDDQTLAYDSATNKWIPQTVSGGGGGTWGSITGTLADQTDLQAALDTKANAGDAPTELNDGSTKASLADAVAFGSGYLMVEDLGGSGVSGFVFPGGFAFYTNTNTDGSGSWYPYFSTNGDGYDFYVEPSSAGAIRFKSGTGGIKFGSGEWAEATFTTDNLTAPRALQFPDEDGALALQAGADDIEITDATKGVILKSPDGTRFRLTVGDDGALSTTEVV